MSRKVSNTAPGSLIANTCQFEILVPCWTKFREILKEFRTFFYFSKLKMAVMSFSFLVSAKF